MIEPGRKFVQGAKKYRYSINGQEKETELNENITTAMYWEYDSRLGRRWNVDPKSSIGVSDYATFFNNPILHNDIHGDSPPQNLSSKYWYMGKIPEFKYNGSISDRPVENVPSAVCNGVIKLLNFVPELWNSGVKNVQGIREGTWAQDVKGELGAMSKGISTAASYPFTTPFNQWGNDFFRTLDKPNTLAIGTSFWVGGKIPGLVGSSKDVSQVFHSARTASAADNILTTGINPAYFNAESRFGKGFYLSTNTKTTAAELYVNGNASAATISYTLKNPVLLNATGGALNLATHMAPKMMGMMARSFGMDGLMYNSVVPGTSGTNVVLFKNFNKLTNGKKVE